MLLYHSHSCRTRPITFAQWWQHGGWCSRISQCSVATMLRREVKREWNPAHKYSLLIAAQVIHVVVHARIQSMSSILGIGLLLLLLLRQTMPCIGLPQPAVAVKGVLTVGKLMTCDSPHSRFGLGGTRVGGWPENGVFMYCFHISFSSLRLAGILAGTFPVCP